MKSLLLQNQIDELVCVLERSSRVSSPESQKSFLIEVFDTDRYSEICSGKPHDFCIYFFYNLSRNGNRELLKRAFNLILEDVNLTKMTIPDKVRQLLENPFRNSDGISHEQQKVLSNDEDTKQPISDSSEKKELNHMERHLSIISSDSSDSYDEMDNPDYEIKNRIFNLIKEIELGIEKFRECQLSQILQCQPLPYPRLFLTRGKKPEFPEYIDRELHDLVKEIDPYKVEISHINEIILLSDEISSHMRFCFVEKPDLIWSDIESNLYIGWVNEINENYKNVFSKSSTLSQRLTSLLFLV